MTTGGDWRVVVPIKGAPLGKSRLSVPGRDQLARAFAFDTLDAAVAAVGASRVLVVTADAVVLRYARAAGAVVHPDPGGGLNPAVAAGLASLEPEPEVDAGPGPGCAVLLGDLPALTAAELVSALAACAKHSRAFVPDREGTGTVLLTAVGSRPEPLFGHGSAARHEAAGHVRLELDLPGLRTDVDVRTDLAAAVELGCGRHTGAVIAELAALPEPPARADTA